MAFISHKYLNLIRELSVSEFKLRDQHMILGFIWTLLYPFSMLLILYMLFSKRLGKGIEHFEIYLLIGLLQWNFFSRATSEAMKSLTNRKRSILRNIRLPKTALVISSVLVAVISFLFEVVVLGGFLIFSGVGFSINVVFFPLIIFIQLLLIIDIALILSCLNVYFRDMQNIWSILLRLGFFLTPIFYPIPMFISEGKMPFYLLNPMTQLMIFARDVLLFKRPPPLMDMFFVFLFVLFLFPISCLIFKKLAHDITERV